MSIKQILPSIHPSNALRTISIAMLCIGDYSVLMAQNGS
jgi:hypothetical protein